MSTAHQVFSRRQDWPERLAAQVAAAQRKPYVLGQHDCARFACLCIEAVTGVDLWPRLGGYSTVRQAHRVAVRLGGSLQGAACALLGVSAAPCLSARRGDLLIFSDESGDHLGVCTGSHVAVLQSSGLLHLRLDHSGMRACVRVG